MLKVIKRDGTIVDFNLRKISEAIIKAFRSLNKEYSQDIIELLSLRVSSQFSSKINDHKIQVEDIQDCVEMVLSVSGYTDVAKSYILYRKQRETVRDLQTQTQAYRKIIEQYLNGEASQSQDKYQSIYSVGGLMLSNSATLTKNYWLNYVYDSQISQAHESGDIYIHDLDMLTADSAGWSLQQLLKNGLNSIDQNISCRPAKHLISACNQLVNFLGIMQNEWAGAQSIPSFDTYLAPFVKIDKLSQEDVNRCMESFIYGVNMPSRWGSQLPFSTVSLDWDVPEDLKNEKAIACGEEQAFTYGDCRKEMKMIQKGFLLTMLHGNDTGRTFLFPIPTITLNQNFDWADDELNYLLFELTSKYGSPYFARANSIQEQGARMPLSDYTKLYHKPCGYFSYGENCGSIGMITINLPRLAYCSKDEEQFFEKLTFTMDLVARALEVKREVLNRFLQSNLYPYTKQYIHSFDQCFGTFGVIGMNEACLYAPWLKEDLRSINSQNFTLKVLNFMSDRLLMYQENTHSFFNLEATPAESVSSSFVSKDKQRYPELKKNSCNFYTNSSNLPSDYTEDVFEALKIEEPFLNIYTGGSAFHVYLNKRIENWKDCRNLVKQISKSFSIPYFTISPTYTVCKKEGYLKGYQENCPSCGKKVEIWTRIAGYYQPIKEWDRYKKEEFLKRRYYEVE